MPTSTDSREPIISLRDVRKSFDGVEVLRGITFDVARAETFVIVGGSGTGKSVTLKHIIGLMKPDSGEIVIDGTDISTLSTVELNDFRRRFGMSFQEGALFDSMSVFDNIAFPLKRHTSMSPKEIESRVDECLDLVHLDSGTAQKRPSELSGGMRRRVGFARAISLQPEILLFDEPTTGLDPVISDVIAELIIEMDERLGVTAVTITHDMKVAFKIADRIAMIHNGTIVENGTPDEFRASTNPLVCQFIEGRAEGPLTEEEWG
jgi:phospholipid/cholesterol/gamma-HCH transport system ATP-binding protein